MTSAHPFAHLGPAPYTFLSLEDESARRALDIQAEATRGYSTRSIMGAQDDDATTCDHCGTSITLAFRFRAADGTEFRTGCDCAEKALDRDEDRKALAGVDRARKAHNRKKAQARAAKRKAAEAVKVAEARALLDAKAEELAAQPHPYANCAARGETLRDSFERRWSMSGAKGRIKLGAELRAL